MTEREGVIKFKLDFRPAPALPVDEIRELNSWRQRLHKAGLIAQNPALYQGLGYGNISRRLSPRESLLCPFVITASQTADIDDLDARHYTTVLSWDIAKNQLAAEGLLPPSSEALTHAALYEISPHIRWVIHVHSPVIWKKASLLGLVITDASIAYGTPAMAQAVQRLYHDRIIGDRGIFAMGGHEDGIVSYGENAESAGQPLLDCLTRAQET